MEDRPRLDELALRLEPSTAWKDKVLAKTELDIFSQIEAYARRPVPAGGSILFRGGGGTGKTMAAGMLAHQLQMDLYRVDLGQVVSKYIGETEKNFGRLFDAAADSAAILFFDEADSLFGKRSGVKDSHDRYFNVEINYLLQRMQEYRGLTILATNDPTVLDPSFLRRFRFVVELSPAAAESPGHPRW
ncbi:MAG TPA: ATP-binding protein [Paludibaculum sp.]|jgi:SpoVK/Ycf46/Vps4 family AAA+-type ATPase